MKHKFVNKIDVGDTEYDIIGAGRIKIGKSANCLTGGRVGFSFGASWGQHGINCGGVLPRREAKKLADRIYELLSECNETEEEYYTDWETRFFSDDEINTQ